jgi:hypothetical protein
MTSWKAEVKTISDNKWYANCLRFATKAEAEQYARDLMRYWLAVREIKTVESDEPVTHVWIGGELREAPKVLL